LLDRLAAEELARPLQRALEALPHEQRDALHGRIAEGMSYQELSEASGVSEELLRTRVSRGLKALQVRLVGGKT
jgi:RNA polymerase sigma-70 factor (ECF subfamily)